MSKKEIQLLNQQIEKLSEQDFDLEAWKKYTILLLARIFGEKNIKISQVNKLEYEFNSWALRDASGNESYEEGTKKLAREIVQAAIDELKVFGLPKISDGDPNQEISEFLNILLDELKGSQVKELKSILNSGENLKEKQRKIKELFDGIGANDAYNIFTSMVMHPTAVQILLDQ